MKERPSILMVNRVYPPVRGATGRLLHDLARHFVKTGYKVTILTTTPHKTSRNSRGAITIQRVAGTEHTSFWHYLFGLWRLYRAMMRNPRHDAIITLSDPPLLHVLGARVARKKKSAHIHWCQDVYPDLLPVLGFPVPDGIYRKLYDAGRAAFAQAKCVVTISRCMQHYLVRTGVNIRRTAVIENWPDQELITPAPVLTVAEAQLPHSTQLRDRRLYSDPAGQKFRVLYAGNIGRAHPVDAIIQAARILHKTQTDVELVFVGKGEGFEALAQARSQYGLDNIRLMPPQPRALLRALMESGDVHLVTMRDEAFGMLMPSKFYSGLAVARPIVFAGPAECDIARLVVRYGCGRVVKPHDGKSLATCIALYRTDSDAWFAAHEGAKAALVGRLPQDAFAAWSSVVKKALQGRA